MPYLFLEVTQYYCHIGFSNFFGHFDLMCPISLQYEQGILFFFFLGFFLASFPTEASPTTIFVTGKSMNFSLLSLSMISIPLFNRPSSLVWSNCNPSSLGYSGADNRKIMLINLFTSFSLLSYCDCNCVSLCLFCIISLAMWSIALDKFLMSSSVCLLAIVTHPCLCQPNQHFPHTIITIP